MYYTTDFKPTSVIIEALLNVFDKYRMPTSRIDEYDVWGRQVLGQKFIPFINQNRPIEFAMLGFPFKSLNDRDKVIGKLPDLGEEVAFKNFGAFIKDIESIYSPGAKVIVVSDGLIFNDILGATEYTVDEYFERNNSFAKSARTTLLTMRDFFPKDKLTTATMRTKILMDHSVTPEVMESRILTDPNVNELYRGMIKFMMGDLAIQDWVSGNQLQKAAKKLAREMMFRNEAYSAFMAKELSESNAGYIRLSMHQSTNNGTKYSFQMIPSKHAWTSPWHAALALDNGEYVTIHRKDAEAQGYQLMYQDGQPYFYQGAQLF